MIVKDGDYYLNSTTGDVFERINGIWAKIGNVKGPPFVPSASKVRAYNSTLCQTLIKSSGWTKVYLPSKEFDTLNEFNLTLYRFVASQSGYYLVTCTMGVTSTAVYLDAAIYVNGVLHSRTATTTVPKPLSSITDIVYLDVGGYIEFYGQSSTTVAVSLILGQVNLWMSIVRLL